MYEKYPACLALICALVVAPLAWGGENDASQAIRELFQQQPQACAPWLSAADLGVPGVLHALYRAEGFQPLWQAPERRTALAHELAQLADDGLDPDHYSAPPSDPAPADTRLQQACADLRSSRDYLRALQHLSRGKVSQEQLEPFWRAPRSHNPVPRRSLLSLAWNGLNDLPGAFAAARPALPQYQALRQFHAAQRRQPLAEWPSVSAGRLLKPSMRDPRVAELASRLVAQGYLPSRPAAAEAHYDEALLVAVRAFQSEHGLQDDGLVGNDTLVALNTSPAARLDQLRVNLERWRWLAGDLEPETLLVDIAGGLLTYLRDGQPVWQGRTQVGRPTRQTPRLKSLVSRLTLNPTWTVPPTILREDKLPEIRRDPNYLAEHQLRVFDHAGKVLDPARIDWQRPGAILLRQDAGPKNPLGRLVLRFANPFSVYLHDTPSLQLFEKSPRAFSSGCVRVEGIFTLLDQVLPAAERQALEVRLAKGRTEQVALERRLPIVLAYWTADLHASGRPLLRNDIYALDAPLLAALVKNPD